MYNTTLHCATLQEGSGTADFYTEPAPIFFATSSTATARAAAAATDDSDSGSDSGSDASDASEDPDASLYALIYNSLSYTGDPFEVRLYNYSLGDSVAAQVDAWVSREANGEVNDPAKWFKANIVRECIQGMYLVRVSCTATAAAAAAAVLLARGLRVFMLATSIVHLTLAVAVPSCSSTAEALESCRSNAVWCYANCARLQQDAD
jgi:hypothetical protein